MTIKLGIMTSVIIRIIVGRERNEIKEEETRLREFDRGLLLVEARQLQRKGKT